MSGGYTGICSGGVGWVWNYAFHETRRLSCDSFAFLHEISHHLRINTNPVLHEIAYSFKIIIFNKIVHEYGIQVIILSWLQN